MKYRVHVRILPRPGLLDPQGQAVEHALATLAFANVGNVHVGKAVDLDVVATSEAEAAKHARAMCDKLLANPVIEDYAVQVEPIS